MTRFLGTTALLFSFALTASAQLGIFPAIKVLNDLVGLSGSEKQRFAGSLRYAPESIGCDIIVINSGLTAQLRVSDPEGNLAVVNLSSMDLATQNEDRSYTVLLADNRVLTLSARRVEPNGSAGLVTATVQKRDGSFVKCAALTDKTSAE